MNNLNEKEHIYGKILAKIRLDYEGVGKLGKLFFGVRNTEKLAEEIREQQVAILSNVPMQGITIEDININIEAYTVTDELNNSELAYAPLELVISADALRDVLRFVLREEFRKIEILEPPNMQLTKRDIERLFFDMAKEMKEYTTYLERKYGR